MRDSSTLLKIVRYGVILGTLWLVTYAKERAVEIDAENINEVCEEVKVGLRAGERVVSVRLKR